MIFNIVRNYPSGLDPILLGRLDMPDGTDTPTTEERIADIRAAWIEFQAEKPDSDSQFMDMLRDRGYKVCELGETVILE